MTWLLDDLLAEFMTPLMSEAGFARRKNRYQLKGGNGAFVSVQVRPWGANNEQAGFQIDWSVISPVLAAYLAREKKRLDWPAITTGLFLDRVVAPESVRGMRAAKHLWECRADDYERFGEVFTGALRAEIIPVWVAALDPRYLLASDIKATRIFGYGPWWELLLTLDDGDPARIEELLGEAATAKVAPEPELLPWLRQRFQARQEA